LKKSVQSLKPDIEEDSNNQNQYSLTDEKQDNSEDKERKANLNELELVNELEETMKSIQNLESLNITENVKKETNKNVEKVEVIDVSIENKDESDIEQIEQDVEHVEDINKVNHLTNELRMENDSKSSLSQIITQNLEKPPQHFSSTEGESKSYIEILDENGNKRETVNNNMIDMIDDKLKSAPAILEDDKTDRLISPESAMSIKSINPVHVSFFILP